MKRKERISTNPAIDTGKSLPEEIKRSAEESDLSMELDKRYQSFLTNPEGKDWDELKKELR
jgi:hypothetical protein